MPIRIEPDTLNIKWFQFPSNGKVHRKVNQRLTPHADVTMFQFPSNGKVHRKGDERTHRMGYSESFNSLQTGKCIERAKPIWSRLF